MSEPSQPSPALVVVKPIVIFIGLPKNGSDRRTITNGLKSSKIRITNKAKKVHDIDVTDVLPSASRTPDRKTFVITAEKNKPNIQSQIDQRQWGDLVYVFTAKEVLRALFHQNGEPFADEQAGQQQKAA